MVSVLQTEGTTRAKTGDPNRAQGMPLVLSESQVWKAVMIRREMRGQTKTLGLYFRGNGEPLKGFQQWGHVVRFLCRFITGDLKRSAVAVVAWHIWPILLLERLPILQLCSGWKATNYTPETPLQRGFWIRFRFYQLEVSVQDLERGNQARAESLLVVLCMELAAFSAGVSQSRLLLIMAVCQFPWLPDHAGIPIMAAEPWFCSWQPKHELLYLASGFLIMKETVVLLVSRFCDVAPKPFSKAQPVSSTFPTIL